MGAGSGVSNTQQAAVLSFLNNYEQVMLKFNEIPKKELKHNRYEVIWFFGENKNVNFEILPSPLLVNRVVLILTWAFYFAVGPHSCVSIVSATVGSWPSAKTMRLIPSSFQICWMQSREMKFSIFKLGCDSTGALNRGLSLDDFRVYRCSPDPYVNCFY